MRGRSIRRIIATGAVAFSVTGAGLVGAGPVAAQTDPISGAVGGVTYTVNQVLSTVEGIPPVEDGIVRSPLGGVVATAAVARPLVDPIFGGNFYCHTQRDGTLVVPAGVNAVQIVAAGGQGGDPSWIEGGAGGLGGVVNATYWVQPGQSLRVSSACQGNGGGGFGGGGGGWQGRGSVLWLDDGAGGGGAATIFLDDRLLVVAAGGGGGGGPTSLGSIAGGRGGAGGAAAPGTNGAYPPGGFPGAGGCGGCSGSLTGGTGWPGLAGGGGGGGGGGFPGGGSGGGGIGAAGGGGGGGGASYIDPWVVAVTAGAGAQSGDGYVFITFGTL
jgi:hypothetical protein